MTDIEILNESWKSVNASGVPEEFKGVVLGELVRVRLGAGALPLQRRPPPGVVPRLSDAETARDPVILDVDSAYETLASETGIDEIHIREVVLVEASGEVHVLPPGRQLGSNNTKRTRNVVSLIAGAHYGAFGERTVSIDVIRAECQDKKCYDPSNFKSTHVGKHDGVSVRGGDVHVNPSKWIAMFKTSLEVARGVDGS